VKTDSVGNMQWNKTYGAYQNEEDHINCVMQTSDGGYAIAGYTKYSSFNDYDFFLLKTDSVGNALWSWAYDGYSRSQDHAYSMIQTSDGGYAIAGEGGPSGNAMLVKTDQDGNL
jgi:hypothetical protein